MFWELILSNTDNKNDTSVIWNPHVHTHVGIKTFSTALVNFL